MLKPWDVLERRVLYSAPPYLEVTRETVQLPDGRIISDYHQIYTGQFASIVPETPDGRILMLRQYRHGARRVGLALPGGRIDDGEDYLAAAQRELKEELGASAESWSAISSWETSCTYGFARVHYFHAKGVRQVQAPASDDLEQSEVVALTRADVVHALQNGGIVSLGHAAPLSLLLINEAFGKDATAEDVRSSVRGA